MRYISALKGKTFLNELKLAWCCFKQEYCCWGRFALQHSAVMCRSNQLKKPKKSICIILRLLFGRMLRNLTHIYYHNTRAPIFSAKPFLSPAQPMFFVVVILKKLETNWWKLICKETSWEVQFEAYMHAYTGNFNFKLGIS